MSKEEDKKSPQHKKVRRNQSKYYEKFKPTDARPEEVAIAILTTLPRKKGD